MGFLLLVTAWSVQGQNVPFGQNAGVNSILPHLIGNLPGFSAQANVTMTYQGRTNRMEMTMRLNYLRGKMRADINMSDVKTSELKPEMIAGLKEIGMDRVTTITDPEAAHTVIVYPGLKSYIHAPPVHKNPAEVKVSKKKLGEKIMQGQLCNHYRVTFSPALKDSVAEEIQIWEAVALGNFPLQIQVSQQKSALTVLFVDLKLTPPEAALFAAPEGFTHFPTMEKVMENAVKKLTP